MDVSLVAQFWVVAVLLTLTPGADWAYAITAGTRSRSVAPSILGMLTGYTLVIAAVAVGVGAVVADHPTALTALTLAGSGYLVFLGVSTLLRRAPQASTPAALVDGTAPDQPLAQYARGLAVSGLNPKGLLLLLALLPQFTSPGGWASTAQMATLGGIHLLNCAVVYVTVARLARRVLRSRPRASTIVTRVAGAAMTVVGLGILVEQLAGVR